VGRKNYPTVLVNNDSRPVFEGYEKLCYWHEFRAAPSFPPGNVRSRSDIGEKRP
jgi:hypothetical protein